ncbi:TolC family protein [soil metagenome]
MLGAGQTPQALSLDLAIALAHQNRPAVRSAELRVEQAHLQRRSLVAPLPTRLDLQATTNRNLYGNDDDVALSQPIDLFGRRKANRSLGDAQIKLVEAGLRQTLSEVQGDVVDLYAATVAAGKLVGTAAAQLQLAQRLLDATTKRAEGGVVAPVQVKRVSLEVEWARQTLSLRQAAQTAARRRLAGALGVPTERVSVEDFAIVPVASAEIATIARQRADLLTLSAQFAIAQANIGVTQAQFRPDFEISARTSLHSYGPGQPAGLRATLSIPVFDYGRRRNEVKAGQAAAEAERRALDDATARAQAELDAVNVELAAANAQAEGFERLLTDTRELVRVSDVGYREGATTLLEVLETTRALREVEESLIESRLRVAQAQAAYLRTTGTLLGGPLR